MIRQAILVGGVAFLAVGCGGSRSGFDGKLTLNTVDGATTVSLASCPTPKCLTVYVAPWCGYCRRASPLIRAFKQYLVGRNVTTRIVVGMDGESAVAHYAREFGPDTLLDPEGRLAVGGVPHFLSSKSDGKIIRDVSGAPQTPDPLTENFLHALAEHLGV